MKYKDCGHYGGYCPCMDCPKLGVSCRACLDDLPDGYYVDTDNLCIVAKKFCENRPKKQQFYYEGVLYDC